MAAINPPSTAYPPVSSHTFTIAGILTTVYGLDELPPSAADIACLWLLHPRLQTQEYMAPTAAATISAWNKRIAEGKAGQQPAGLIAVSFDQRNHGSREVDTLANAAWRDGNPRHAQDMFSVYHGTSTDTSLLLTHLPSYIFSSPGSPQITKHLVLGVSLGGHAAWPCILHDPRITAAVVVIGCPDFTRLMTDRAAKSKLDTWTSTSPPGSTFLGSPDFPKALIDAVAQYDPVGLLIPGLESGVSPSPAQLSKFEHLLRQHLNGKSILNLCGAVDKLVPYAAGEAFFTLLRNTIRNNPSINLVFDDVSFDGVGHAYPDAMLETAVAWICDLLAGGADASRTSKI